MSDKPFVKVELEWPGDFFVRRRHFLMTHYATVEELEEIATLVRRIVEDIGKREDFLTRDGFNVYDEQPEVPDE